MSDYRSPEVMEENLAELAENTYPGRGIVIGLNSAGDTAMQIYWLMGRSEPSRARVLVREIDPESQDGAELVRTAPHNLPEDTDTSLIIYNAMRRTGNSHIVSNGHQTDDIVDYIRRGKLFAQGLEMHIYEPDAPNYTPRISGYTEVESGIAGFRLSIISKSSTSEEAIRAFFPGAGQALFRELTPDDKGVGYCIHTYNGDGNPLPSFNGTPYGVPLGETVDEVAETYWDTLNSDNRVALVVKGIQLTDGNEDYRIINVHH